MTVVPLPDTSTIRVRLDYTQTDGFKAGSRFFLSYAGSPPTGANCTTIANDIEVAWLANLAGLIPAAWSLTEIDVLDITTETGLSGQWTGVEAGTRDGTALPAQVASGVEYDIALRYRGGKPRMYLPGGVENDLLDAGRWTTDFTSGLGAVTSEFFTAVEAIDVGAVGALQHINLSYYKGFTNVTNSSGRTRAAPKYRATALSTPVTGYAGKQQLSSQKRRRSATSY